MRFRAALTLFLAFRILSPVISAAGAPAGSLPPITAPATVPAPDDERETEMEIQVKRMGSAFQQLMGQVADPAHNASSLQLLSTMEDAVKGVLKLNPDKAGDMPADQRAKFEDDAKPSLRHLQEMFAKLRNTLTSGKNDDAVKIVADIDAFFEPPIRTSYVLEFEVRADQLNPNTEKAKFSLIFRGGLMGGYLKLARRRDAPIDGGLAADSELVYKENSPQMLVVRSKEGPYEEFPFDFVFNENKGSWTSWRRPTAVEKHDPSQTAYPQSIPAASTTPILPGCYEVRFKWDED